MRHIPDSFLILFTLILTAGNTAFSDQREPLITINWASDLFFEEQVSKDSPHKSYDLKVRAFSHRTETHKTQISILSSSLSLGKPGLVVGPEKTLINSALGSRFLQLKQSNIINSSFSTAAEINYGTASDEPFEVKEDIQLNSKLALTHEPKNIFIQLDNDENRGYLNSKPILNFGVSKTESFRSYTISLLNLSYREVFLPDLSVKFELTPSSLLVNYCFSICIDDEKSLRLTVRHKSFLHANRMNKDSRLNYRELKFEYVYSTLFKDNQKIALNLGYAFNREIYQSNNLYGNEGEKVKLRPDIFGGFTWSYF